jgi:hypothetical protein
MKKRHMIRKRLQILGSVYGDCLGSFCCPCCVLVQQEREVQKYQEEMRNQGYQLNEYMQYH